MTRINTSRDSDPFYIEGFILNGTHNAVEWNSDESTYDVVQKTMQPGANVSYPGVLTFPDGSSGYTTLKMSKTRK